MDYNSSSNDSCLTQDHLDRVKNADYSNQSYLMFGPNTVSNQEVYEIVIKIVLCLITIFASLIGNLLVLYTMFVLPKLRKAFTPAGLPLNAISINNLPISQVQFSKRNTITTHMNLTYQKKLSGLPNQNIIHGSLSTVRNNIIRRHSIFSGAQNQCQVYAPAPSPLHRKTVNLFILNLIICDLMIVFWCSWVHMVNSITDRWLLGAFFCRFNTFVQIVSVIAAISTLSIISYERFTGIVCNMKNKLTRKKSGIIVICIWIFSSIAAAPALIYRKHFNRQWLDHVESWCTDEWPRIYNVKIMNDTKCISSIEEPLRKIYYTFISCVLFFIPIVFMSICYCLIIFKLSANHIPGENHLEKQLLFKRRKNVAILLVWLLVSFAICWSPVQILLLHEAHRDSYREPMPYWFNWVHFLFYLLAYANSAINPIMYSGLHKHYRQGFKVR